MNDDIFICNQKEGFPENGEITWESPSNIALIKYWGKRHIQITANPSLSFTLKNCITKTKLSFKRADSPNIKLFIDGHENSQFLKKIETFLDRINNYCSYISDYSLKIETENTFPHSSGIASSASGFSALALCIVSIEKHTMKLSDEDFYKKASFISRLGSGSACRSIYGHLALWGNHPSSKKSSDYFATPYNDAHNIFSDFQDSILIVDKSKKKVSSSVGHNLMNDHPYAKTRFIQANSNMRVLTKALNEGDLSLFNQIVEKEALVLHAMMMTSTPSFILMKPNTLNIIEKIGKERDSSGLPLSFTLDAGANVHLLYPSSYKTEVTSFIENELIGYCENQQYICDEVGNGPLLKREHYA